jgi:hypothetical protein
MVRDAEASRGRVLTELCVLQERPVWTAKRTRVWGPGIGQGKVKQKRCGPRSSWVSVGLTWCTCTSRGNAWRLAHCQVGASGGLFFSWLFFFSFFCWLTSEHGPCPVDSVVITGCCFSRPKQHSNDYLTIFIGSLAMALQFSVKSYGWPRW